MFTAAPVCLPKYTEAVTGQGNMSKLETLIEDGLRSEILLQQQLRALCEAFRQQLQETEKRQTEELERRIHQNALLSTGGIESGDKNELNSQIRTSATVFSLASDKDTAPVSSTNRKHSVGTLMPIPNRTHQCERLALSKTTQMIKEEEAEAECQKKFCALPAPSHVIQPLYQEMIEMREKERKQGCEQRKNFLLSIQKPFSFQEREREKREKSIALLKVKDQKNKTATVRTPHKVEEDLSESELKDQEQVCRKVSTKMMVRQENLSASGNPRLRTAERTRKEKLGFLDEKPCFHPKIIHQVPDFSSLHKALQTDVQRKTQNIDVTKCQPFSLRTSALPARQRRMNPENSLVSKINFTRSKSLGALTSLSTDTLPTYITDAARKRCLAIRNSMEMRESKNQESADWLRKYQMRSQAMKKTVALHAKLLDPHSSLNEVFNEKLQHHREADQQRMKEYMKELQEMKARVQERPYLFEQVKQKNAKAYAQQIFRDKLKKAGLNEQFVEENGKAVEEVSTSSSTINCSSENDIHNREENVDGWEKIEDVEEESVKSKGE